MARPRFQEARFHVDSGPEALFERVRQKMAGARELRLHASHYRDRANERRMLVRELARFDPKQWQLLTAGVRTDTGKFVNSTWVRSVDGQEWAVVIGLHDTVQTVYPLSGRKDGPDIVRSGPLYDMVARVNAELLMADGVECTRVEDK